MLRKNAEIEMRTLLWLVPGYVWRSPAAAPNAARTATRWQAQYPDLEGTNVRPSGSSWAYLRTAISCPCGTAVRASPAFEPRSLHSQSCAHRHPCGAGSQG